MMNTNQKDYDTWRSILANASDVEILNIAQAISRQAKQYDAETFGDYQFSMDMTGGEIQLSDTPFYHAQVSVLPDHVNDYVMEKISESQPTDLICLDSHSDKYIIGLWKKDDWPCCVPSDLFFSGTVPLTDCIIKVDERPTGGVQSECRVVVFNDYDNCIQKMDEYGIGDAGCLVGTVIPKLSTEDSQWHIPIAVVPGKDGLGFVSIGWMNEKAKSAAKSLPLFNGLFGDEWFQWLATWYGIQIALLHPVVKEVFLNPEIVRHRNGGGRTKSGRRKARYIKRHIINISELERICKKESGGKFNRKCLAWYVIGHWRTYKNGNTIFVKPYWKGPLRKTKSSVDLQIREREICADSMIDRR